MAELWEKLAEERSKAFRAFGIYRDLGPDRAIVKVRDALGKTAGYDRQLQEWASRFHWRDRVEAYDVYLDEKRRKENEDRIRKMNDRQAEQGATLQKIGMLKIQTLPRTKDGNIDIEAVQRALSNSEAARYVDLGVKIERIALGEPTEIQGEKLVELPDEVADRLAKVLEKLDDKHGKDT